MAAVAPLLNLTNSGSGSDAINKVAVARLWSFVICLNVVELILFWQNIKTCNLCSNLPWSKIAGLCPNPNYPQPTTLQNRSIFRELNNVTLAELPSKLIRQTLVSTFASWITTHIVSNSCRSTAVSAGTTNNQVPSIKSKIWWRADQNRRQKVFNGGLRFCGGSGVAKGGGPPLAAHLWGRHYGPCRRL